MTNRSTVTRAVGCAFATCTFFLAAGPVLNAIEPTTRCPVVGHAPSHDAAHAIPAFARKFNLPCQTCHSAPPYLNATGRKFMEAGYRMPDEDGLIDEDQQS